MEHEIRTVSIGTKTYFIKAREFDGDIDTEILLQIDHSNLLGENITFPVFLNRVGLLRADAEYEVTQAKFRLKVHVAGLTEKFRSQLTSREVVKETKAGEKTYKVNKPTKDEVDNAVTLDVETQNLEQHVYAAQKAFTYVDELYWSAKSKDQKLNKLFSGVKPEDFTGEILDGTINGVLIQKSKFNNR